MKPITQRLRCAGIGQATAISFAREGCTRIAIADQNESGLLETANLITEAAKQCGIEINVLSERTDVLSESEINDLLDGVITKFGRIDYCCNCAGEDFISRFRRLLMMGVRHPQQQPALT